MPRIRQVTRFSDFQWSVESAAVSSFEKLVYQFAWHPVYDPFGAPILWSFGVRYDNWDMMGYDGILDNHIWWLSPVIRLAPDIRLASEHPSLKKKLIFHSLFFLAPLGHFIFSKHIYIYLKGLSALRGLQGLTALRSGVEGPPIVSMAQALLTNLRYIRCVSNTFYTFHRVISTPKTRMSHAQSNSIIASGSKPPMLLWRKTRRELNVPINAIRNIWCAYQRNQGECQPVMGCKLGNIWQAGFPCMRLLW